jgi:hypothetical protein
MDSVLYKKYLKEYMNTLRQLRDGQWLWKKEGTKWYLNPSYPLVQAEAHIIHDIMEKFYNDEE